MTQALLIDMFYAAPELWYLIGAAFIGMLGLLGYSSVRILKLKQKNYFLNRDRERYAETLYASKDGYFAFIYPDEKVNDPRKTIKERCSRRLAVILNLPNGTSSTFEEILKNFYKDDIKKIQKYTGLLHEDGVSFEDEFSLKNNNKHIRLTGSRINGTDGNVYCDMIWFRDISFESIRISDLEEDKNAAFDNVIRLEDMINNIAYPVWLRDEKLNIVLSNKKFKEFIENSGTEILNVNGESISRNLALLAQTSNKIKRQSVNIIRNGERRFYEVIETPFHIEQKLDRICTVGSLVDVNELDELKRNLKLHQNAHLEILGALGTAFAVFNDKYKLSFYNKAFVKLWGVEEVWLESKPTYFMFLDLIREKRMLPEVPDFRLYKNDEQKDFNAIIEAKEDMLHLPNGQTFRRVRAPHPMGGLIFAFEDVSDRLATRRAYNALLSVQKEILDNLFEAVLIFGSNGRLNFYNQAYLKLWQVEESFLQKEPNLPEIIDSQKEFFSNADDWDSLRKDIVNHLTSVATKAFALTRNDKLCVEVISGSLSDSSMMVIYKVIDLNN